MADHVTETREAPEQGVSVAQVSMTVNGDQRRARVEPRKTLADVLREDFGFTGTHVGCEHGVCGACTVLLDGAGGPRVPHLRRAGGRRGRRDRRGADAAGRRPVRRPAGLPRGARPAVRILHTGLRGLGHRATCGTIRTRRTRRSLDGLSGNLCRCTGYQGIVGAVRRVARELAEARNDCEHRHRTWSRATGSSANRSRRRRIHGCSPDAAATSTMSCPDSCTPRSSAVPSRTAASAALGRRGPAAARCGRGFHRRRVERRTRQGLAHDDRAGRADAADPAAGGGRRSVRRRSGRARSGGESLRR